MKPLMAIVALFGFLAGCLYWLPASLVLDTAMRMGLVSEKITVGRVVGRVWEGQVMDIRVAGRTVEEAQWHWRPSGLGRAELTWEVSGRASGVQMDAEVRWRPNRIAVRDLVFMIPARRIAEEWVSWPLTMAGVIEGRIDSLDYQIESKQIDAQGTVRWEGAASGYPKPAYLGWVEANLATVEGGEALAVGLVSDQRFLVLDGEVTVNLTGAYSMSLNATPGPKAEPQLINALRLLGLAKTDDRQIRLRSAGMLAPGGLQFPVIDSDE